MKKTLILLLFALMLAPVVSYADEKPNIEVTGSAEMEVIADEIILAVGFSEYFEEEYQEGKKYEDYKTKVPMEKIEPLVLKQLKELGIKNDQITLQDGGNSWQQRGKNFLKRKELHISIKDFKQVDVLMTKLDVRGLDRVSIHELKNKKLQEYRKQVKINALKAAQEKAKYLVESLDKKLGSVLTIVEQNYQTPNYGGVYRLQSNTVLRKAEMDSEYDNFRKIQLRYEVKAKFEIL